MVGRKAKAKRKAEILGWIKNPEKAKATLAVVEAVAINSITDMLEIRSPIELSLALCRPSRSAAAPLCHGDDGKS